MLSQNLSLFSVYFLNFNNKGQNIYLNLLSMCFVIVRDELTSVENDF